MRASARCPKHAFSILAAPPPLPLACSDLFNSKLLSEMNSPADPELHPGWQMKPVFKGEEKWVSGWREKVDCTEIEKESFYCFSLQLSWLWYFFFWMLIKTAAILTERPVKEVMGNELFTGRIDSFVIPLSCLFTLSFLYSLGRQSAVTDHSSDGLVEAENVVKIMTFFFCGIM